MPADIGVNPDLDYLLDPQQAKPVGFCIRCFREIYSRKFGRLCLDCLEKGRRYMNETIPEKPVLECSQSALIRNNIPDAGEELAQIRQTILNLPRTRENLPEVKRVRALLNKKIALWEVQRKTAKAAALLEYENANKAYQEKVALPLKEAEELCADFVTEVEEAAKKACEEELREYFTELCQTKGIFWLPFEKLGIKVTLAMADQAEPRKAMDTIRQRVEQVEQDLNVISGMEDAVDIQAEYEQTLNLTAAIARVQDRKQALEVAEQNRKHRENILDQAGKAAQQIADVIPRVLQQEQEMKYEVVFKVKATISMLRALKIYLENHNISYEEVTE